MPALARLQTGLVGLDDWLVRTSPRWRWLGELALVWIGVHHAADRVDDAVAALLGGLPWWEPDLPLAIGAWCAVALELYVDGWAAWARARGAEGGWSPTAAAAVALWATASVAGVWVAATAVEDVIGSWWVGALVGAGLAARVAGPGLAEVVKRPPPRAVAASLVPVVAVAALAVRYGWPIWGWLP